MSGSLSLGLLLGAGPGLLLASSFLSGSTLGGGATSVGFTSAMLLAVVVVCILVAGVLVHLGWHLWWNLGRTDEAGRPTIASSLASGVVLTLAPAPALVVLTLLLAPLSWKLGLVVAAAPALVSPGGLCIAGVVVLAGGSLTAIPPGFYPGCLLFANFPFYAWPVHRHRLRSRPRCHPAPGVP